MPSYSSTAQGFTAGTIGGALRTRLNTPAYFSGAAQAAANHAATMALTGGYRTTPGNLCPACRTYRASNGTCLC